MPEYVRASLSDLDVNESKPGTRWEVSPALGIEEYNFNVAVLEPGEWLSENGFHYHENQREFFYVVDGRCRVETEEDSFDLEAGGMVYFEAGIPHLLHNASADPCELVAIGSPPDGRYPVHQVAAAEEWVERD